MKKDYTHGPWHASDGSIHSSKGKLIAETGFGIVPAKQDEANTRIMAAAPDMIEALIRIQSQLESASDRFTMLEDIQRITNAAINKALKGGNQ